MEQPPMTGLGLMSGLSPAAVKAASEEASKDRQKEWADKILAEAETWLGTRFEHGQRCKGAGVDCGQFLIGVYHNVGVMANIKVPYYPKDFHLHRDREWYKELVEEWADEIPGPPAPADVVLYKQGRLYSHGAIVVLWPRIIHTYIAHGVIYADGTQGDHGSLPRKFFRPKILLGCGDIP